MSGYVVELAQTSPRYGQVHRAGCRDVQDPEPVPDRDSAAEALGWEGPLVVAPCAR